MRSNDTSDPDALDRLCAVYGIAIEYADGNGITRRVATSTKRALLAALGATLDDDADAQYAIDAYCARRSRRCLEPVQVRRVTAGETPITITLPAVQAENVFHWELALENGAQHSGSVVPATLPVLERSDIHGIAFARYAFQLPQPPDVGYHRFTLRASDTVGASSCDMTLIIVPERCYQPEALAAQQRRWGFALQLYALRSPHNWGIGDFSDLLAVTEYGAGCGASLIGINPLHALFPSSPVRADPYSPSSRLFTNVLYLDVEAIADFRECDELRESLSEPSFQAQLRSLRSEELVQYPQVAMLKMAALERLHGHFRSQHLLRDSDRAKAFRAFCAEGGASLRYQTCFDALYEHFLREGNTGGWTSWPSAYHDPDSDAVAAFADSHAGRLEFFAYLYWQAELQLATAGRAALEKGLGIGLYQELSLGCHRDGAEVWAHQALFAAGVDMGAPPDESNSQGYNWGLPPLLPTYLRGSGYAAFIDLLRCNMRHAGALRIDHVIGLARQFWIPAGARPEEGSYVDYPLQDLLGILALESCRSRCLIVGEDIGSAPAGLRDLFEAAGLLSYRVLLLETESNAVFKASADYSRQALVTASTHDLPTLTGFWQGHDLDLRQTLQLFPGEEIRRTEIIRRVQERTRLLMALEKEDLLPANSSVFPASTLELTTELMQAIHRYLARTPAKIMVVRPEDVFGQLQQVNLSYSIDGYPNWQYKLPLNLEEWGSDDRLLPLIDALNRERGPADVARLPSSSRPRRVPLKIPQATYRLQFSRDFTFAQATALIPYLSALGVSHCYASPYLQARPGSRHGYDIVDHRSLNSEIGTTEDFERFVATLRKHDMGHILDMVPNHMAVMGSDNAWWLDVLENGQASIYADCFDIDWDTYQYDLGRKILLPVLGDHYAKVLDSGELRLLFDAARGEFSITYLDHRFPVDPREYPRIIGHRMERLSARLPADDLRGVEYGSLVTAFGHLPPRDDVNAEKVAERARDKELHKRQLAALCAVSEEIAAFVAENVAEINIQSAEQAGAGRLHELISTQAYRLSFWRVASDEINFRRFFDINDLAALRMENEAVFNNTHALVLKLIEDGKIDGLRIDHPDGLYDPAAYFSRLQHHFVADPALPLSGQSFEDSQEAISRPIYVVIEKILAEHETLPQEWPVYGTTGYDFANLVNGVFVKADTAERMRRIYNAFIVEMPNFDDIAYRSKALIMRGALASELNVLANQLSRIAQADRYTCDYTLNNLRRALADLVACFPVYRSYVTAAGASAMDLHYIDLAVATAKKRSQAADISIFDFLRDVVSTRIAEGKNQGYRDAVTTVARKFQQYTAPVMAKGFEDTSFYIYNRLTSLNEVGGDPRRYGVSVGDFHRANQTRAQSWPHAMLATSTHDSKRSEDVRARINVLSELPDDWRRALARWHRFNLGKKRRIDNLEVPSRNEEYLLYQTLLGVWPWQTDDMESMAQVCARVEQYMLKAVREAKVHSSWVNSNGEYEEAVAHFVRAVLAANNKRFLCDFRQFSRRIAWFGMLNSLGQLLLKLTAPGVPDIYQGNELWDFSLVDPDNRRPVEYPIRQSLLQALMSLGDISGEELNGRLRALLENPDDGRIKLYLTWKTLALRREAASLFEKGGYLPLDCRGDRAAHLCAFARRLETQVAVVAVPRLACTLMQGTVGLPVGDEVWGDTTIELPAPIGRWENVLNHAPVTAQVRGGNAAVAAVELFRDCPFALLRPSLISSG